ncbi:hypothetical protein FKM82_026462 [Ascaphus truei]
MEDEKYYLLTAPIPVPISVHRFVPQLQRGALHNTGYSSQPVFSSPFGITVPLPILQLRLSDTKNETDVWEFYQILYVISLFY